MRFGRLAGVLVLALVMAASVVAPATAQQAPSRGYLIGSDAPLTPAQVRQLEQAGANVKHVYKNFGGAAAVIADQHLAAVRALPFVTGVGEDTLKQLDGVSVEPLPADRSFLSSGSALPGAPYWLDLMDAEKNTTYTGAGVWVAVLDSGFYPNWRDYFDESAILTNLAAAFVSVTGNPNDNQWDVGSDPHGMAVAATIVGHRFRDKEGEGGFGQGYATGAAGAYWVPGVAPGAKIIPVKVCEPIGCWGSAISAGVDYIIPIPRDHAT